MIDYEDRFVHWVLHVFQPWLEQYKGLRNEPGNQAQLESSIASRIRGDCEEFLSEFSITFDTTSYPFDWELNLTVNLKDGHPYRGIEIEWDEHHIRSSYGDRDEGNMKPLNDPTGQGEDPVKAYERAMSILDTRG